MKYLRSVDGALPRGGRHTDAGRRQTAAASHARPHGRRRVASIAAVGAIVLVAFALTGCLRIMTVTAPTNVEAGPDYVITVGLQPLADANGARGTLAFRHPAGWEVTSVSYSGDQTGVPTRAVAIEQWFATTWEAKPADATHNGHKNGYSWWAGYTEVENVKETDDIYVTIRVDTHGVGGAIYLDFVAGITDPAKPTDPAANGDNWSSGDTITNGSDGVVLNFAVNLYEGKFPHVASTDPASGATNVPINTDPRVTFFEKMMPASITAANVYVRLAGGGAALPATVSYNATTQQALIDLNAPLQYSTNYLLIVKTGVRDLVGYYMAADYIAPFTTAAMPTAPQVVSRTPAAGSTGVGLGTDVTATFDQPIDPATLNGASFVLERSSGGGWAPVAASVTYSGPTATAVLNPAADLEYESTYRATLTTSIRGANSVPLAAAVSWTFTTLDEPLPPEVVSTTPDDDAVDVPLDTDVRATFAAPIDPTSLDEESFVLQRSEGGGWADVDSSVTYDGPAKTAVLEPDDALEYGALYRATLTTAVEGANGVPLAAPVTWTFTTEEEPAPAFIDVQPDDPYYTAITGLAAQKIISGYMVAPGVWEFRPENPVRRAQFAKMIDGALGLPVTEADDDSPFTDLGPDVLLPSAGQDNLYPHEYVTIAWQNGITTGKTAKSFAPYDEISRAAVVTMVVRAVKNLLPPGTLATPPAGYSNAWGTSFDSVHGPNARIAEYNGLLAGLPLAGGASDPWGVMPRGEVAQVLWNMMSLTP